MRLFKKIKNILRPKTIYLVQERHLYNGAYHTFCIHGFRYNLKDAKKLVESLNLNHSFYRWNNCDEIDSANSEWHYVDEYLLTKDIFTDSRYVYIEEIQEYDERYSL